MRYYLIGVMFGLICFHTYCGCGKTKPRILETTPSVTPILRPLPTTEVCGIDNISLHISHQPSKKEREEMLEWRSQMTRIEEEQRRHDLRMGRISMGLERVDGTPVIHFETGDVRTVRNVRIRRIEVTK